MKIYYQLSLFLFLTCMITNCTSDKNSIKDYIKTKVDLNYKESFSIVILPFDACNTCIHATLEYISTNPDILNNNKLILYNFLSLKSKKIQYGDELFEHTNTIIDREGNFLDFDFKHNQPMVIKIQDKNLKNIEDLDSENYFELLSKIH
ncbi:MAG: hypothetical protein HLUCCX10_06240 [Algoriphagus marincola HL-49]|uniref:Uncharacterized protein n=1 Tax=Algoriphagus marincola HL-49 TaxID=1305737 RepID=A0A0P7YQI6_9BACT|nr:MAG: hypothetical protein HLUCCX10_06240 [Algoriphagus marincola HL-49]